MKREVLRLDRVSCLDHGVVQLDGFNLSVISGEIVGLFPINNHGLTALINLLQYNTALRYGYVYYLEEQVNTWRSSKQRSNRIGFIQSESCLVDGLTVADNIFVLRPGFKQWFVKTSLLRKQLIPFLESINIYIPADAYADELSAFEKIVVDVLKSVVAGYKLIVLREISVNISESELKKIHQLLKNYSEQGFSFLYIDFHFEELIKVCGKIALMANGRIVKYFQSDAVSGSVLGEDFHSYLKAFSGIQEQTPLKEAELFSKTDDHGFEARNVCGEFVSGLSFTLPPGECVLIQSAEAVILSEIISLVSGEIQIKSGTLLIDNVPLRRKYNEIAIMQELPVKMMLFPEMSYTDNLCFLMDKNLPEVWRSGAVREGVRRECAPVLGDVFDKRIDVLSEVQKYDLLYTRIALGKPKVVFCVRPFRRADMRLRTHIRHLIKMLLAKGIAVVILSANSEDGLSLANQVIKI